MSYKSSLVGLFLLERNNAVLEIKINEKQKESIQKEFESYYLEQKEGKTILCNYDHLPPYEFDDEKQIKYRIDESQIPYFGEIKTNLLKSSHESINTKSDFDGIRNREITAWIVHIELHEGGKKRDIFLMQSFYKQNMLVTKSKLDSVLSMTFFSDGGFFKVEEQDSSLNLKKIMNVVYIDDKMLYILDRDKTNIIFNEDARIQSIVDGVFKETVLDNTDIFELGSGEKGDDLTTSVQGNIRMAKRMYSIHQKGILKSTFQFKKFKKHLDNEGIIGLINPKTQKIILSKHQLEELLDALNNNFFSSWDGVTKYKATSKRIRT